MGILYSNDFDYLQGIGYMEKAMQHYKKAGKERLQYIAMRNIGQIYLDMGNRRNAETLFDEVLAWGKAHNDTYIIYSTLDQLLRLHDATENIEALGYLLGNYSIEEVLRNSTTFGTIAHYHALMGDKVSAKEYLSKAWKISETAKDTAMLWHKSYQLNKTFRHAEAALRDYERLFEMQDSVVRITLQQPLIASQRDHYQTQLELTSSRLLNYRYLAGISVLILLIAAIILYIYIRNRLRHKQEELNGYIELADELRHTLYHKEESIVSNEAAMERIRQELQLSHAQLEELRTQLHTNGDAMQAQIAELFGTYSKLLNSLSETYYENQGSKSAIFAQIEKEIKKISEGNMIVELEAILNTNLDNIMARLRAELPHLKEKDYVFLTLLYARFSGKTIATFMKLERNHIYQIKHRLRDEIKSSDAPSRDFFLKNLE